MADERGHGAVAEPEPAERVEINRRTRTHGLVIDALDVFVPRRLCLAVGSRQHGQTRQRVVLAVRVTVAAAGLLANGAGRA